MDAATFRGMLAGTLSPGKGLPHRVSTQLSELRSPSCRRTLPLPRAEIDPLSYRETPLSRSQSSDRPGLRFTPKVSRDSALRENTRGMEGASSPPSQDAAPIFNSAHAPFIPSSLSTDMIEVLSSFPGAGTKADLETERQGDSSPWLENSTRTGLAGRTKLRVAVDLDEVLGSFLTTLAAFCKDEYKISHELEEFFVYDFKQIWKCSQEEANHRVHQFFASSHFHNGIPTIPGAADVLERLSQSFDFVVVTSRQHVIQQPTLTWLDRHYPDLFSEVHFGNHYALQGKAKPKSEICRDIGATILIDDNPAYAMECASNGMRVLLFDWNLEYAWSKTDDGPAHPLITRVRDWEDVEMQLLLHVKCRD